MSDIWADRVREIREKMQEDPDYAQTVAELKELEDILPAKKKAVEFSMSPFGAEVPDADLSRYHPGDSGGILIT